MSEHLTDVDRLLAKAEQLELYEQKKWYFNPQEYPWLAAQLREVARLRTTLTGVSTCSTCEACRGAALRALDERTTAQMNAAVDERLGRVERELAASMVARCEHGNPIDPTGGYVCLKCFRAPSTTPGAPK